MLEELKKEHRVTGLKRKMEDTGCNEGVPEKNEARPAKKLCESLNLSGTCERLGDIALSSDHSNCSSLRGSDSSDLSVDVSGLLERTRDTGEVDRLLEGARELLIEVMEDIPNLTSSSDSIDEPSSDSGNSEVEWGGNIMNLGRGDLVRGPNGEVAAVSLGNDSSSDVSAESKRIRAMLAVMTDSASYDSWSSSSRSVNELHSDSSASVEVVIRDYGNGESIQQVDQVVSCSSSEYVSRELGDNNCNYLDDVIYDAGSSDNG